MQVIIHVLVLHKHEALVTSRELLVSMFEYEIQHKGKRQPSVIFERDSRQNMAAK